MESLRIENPFSFFIPMRHFDEVVDLYWHIPPLWIVSHEYHSVGDRVNFIQPLKNRTVRALFFADLTQPSCDRCLAIETPSPVHAETASIAPCRGSAI
jgi:hypothetical protein